MLLPLLDGVSRKAARHHRSKPFTLRNNAPIVSFTFDDVPESAATEGAAILEAHGIRGTFYIAGGICGGMDSHWRVVARDQVRALHDRGHEIGCHTFSHIAVERLDAATMEQECRLNQVLLQTLCPGLKLENFCYPFGRASLPRKLQLQKRFLSCRGIYEGVNSGSVDLGMLRVIELYDRTLTPEKLQRVLRENKARNGWLIFYSHDVTPSPSWIGCSPELLRATVEAVQAAKFACLPVRGALAAIGYAPAAVTGPAASRAATASR